MVWIVFDLSSVKKSWKWNERIPGEFSIQDSTRPISPVDQLGFQSKL